MAEPITNVLGIVSIKNRGEYNSTTTYEKLNVVSYNGSSYCAKGNTVGNLPTNTDYWDLLAEKGDQGIQGPAPVRGVDYWTETDIESIESTLSEDVENEVSTQIGSLTSATPLVATATAEMVDTTRIYVNTTDGNWYYYDGDSWEIGGPYQSTGISNNSISIDNLDNSLQNSFIKEFSGIDLPFDNVGYCKVVDNALVVDADSDYGYSIIDLDINNTYEFSGFNFYLVCGLIVIDGNDNIVYSTRGASRTSQGLTPVYLKFKANTTGLKAYISASNNVGTSWTNFRKNNVTLSKYSNMSVNYKENNVNCIKQIDNKFIHENTALDSNPILDDASDTICKVYKMCKNISYTIETANLWAVSGLVITDNNYKTLYTSSDSYHGSIENFKYSFTAEKDGYIYLSSVPNRFVPSIKINNYLETLFRNLKYVYQDKKWAAMGDSLTAVGTLGTNVKNYVNYVSESLGLPCTNYGYGGAGYLARKQYNQAFYQIADTLDNDVDVITVFGSFNDTYTTLSTYGWGTINDTNDTTIFGAMNKTFDNLITNYPNAVIGVIIPTPWDDRNNIDCTAEEKEKANTYVNGLKQICERRSIPYLDLYTKSNLYPWNSTFNSLFFKDGDGCHPNTNGHRKIAGQIEEFIKSLLYSK